MERVIDLDHVRPLSAFGIDSAAAFGTRLDQWVPHVFEDLRRK
ncbi:hypothetical protein [Streptomyces sp. LN325]